MVFSVSKSAALPVTALLLSAAIPAPAQVQHAATHLRISGAFLSIGKQENNTYPRYLPFSVGGEFLYSFRCYGPARQPRRVAAYAVVEPFFSAVRTASGAADWEGGATAGVRTLWQLGARRGACLYGTVNAGPFYYSADVERQAPGFLFSDNFGLGMYTRLGPAGAAFPLLLNTQVRWRHLSNASTRLPNWGINTVHILVGISRAARRPAVAI